MYPPRSEKYSKKKKDKQRGQNRFWLGLNVSLILIIVVLGTYFYLSDLTTQSSPKSGDADYSSDVNGDNGKGGEVGSQIPDQENQSPDVNNAVQEPDGSDSAAEPDEAGNRTGNSGQKEIVPDETQDPDPVQNTDPDERLLIHFAGIRSFPAKWRRNCKRKGMITLIVM